MIRHRPTEEWLAELDNVVHRYRVGIKTPGARDTLTPEEALKLMRKLGFTNGEALRLLRHKEWSRE